MVAVRRRRRIVGEWGTKRPGRKRPDRRASGRSRTATIGSIGAPGACIGLFRPPVPVAAVPKVPPERQGASMPAVWVANVPIGRWQR